MGVGFVVGDEAVEVGSPGFLKGFFATIAFYLEPDGWGTKYPELMNELYGGRLDSGKATKVLSDVRAIREALRAIRPVKIVWDVGNPDAPSPWKTGDVPPDKDLSECFITSRGKNLFDVLIRCLELLGQEGKQMTIEPY